MTLLNKCRWNIWGCRCSNPFKRWVWMRFFADSWRKGEWTPLLQKFTRNLFRYVYIYIYMLYLQASSRNMELNYPKEKRYSKVEHLFEFYFPTAAQFELLWKILGTNERHRPVIRKRQKVANRHTGCCRMQHIPTRGCRPAAILILPWPFLFKSPS